MRIKKSIKLAAALAAVCACAFGYTPRATAQTLTDTGASPPTPGAIDISMVDVSAPPSQPAGLNYYSNGGGFGNPGQIFTTSNNPTGYIAYYAYFLTGGGAGSGGGVQFAQSWNLNVYSIQKDINGAYTNAVHVTTLTATGVSFFPTDWLQWSNISVALAPNTTYAFTYQNTGNGWELMDGEDVGVDGSLIPGASTNGAACLIPGAGGAIAVTNNYAPGWMADFDIGLMTNTTFNVYAPSVATPGNIYPIQGQMGAIPAFTLGTTVTLTDGTPLGGVAPYTYTWRTDGGTGGAMTAIPGDSGQGAPYQTITVTPAALGTFLYDVVVSDSTTYVKTTGVATVWIALPDAPATILDEGPTALTASCYIYDIVQTTNGGTGDAMNYYDNNQWNGGAAVGQTFTTGANAGGYTLTSVQIGTGGPGMSSGSTTTPQTDYLAIYKIDTDPGKATILQVITNNNADSGFAFGNWVQWDGLNVTLTNNAVYAYTFQNGNNGWAGLATSPYTNSYEGGEICQINPRTGLVEYDPTNTSAAFVLGLTAIGQTAPTCPLAGPVSVSPPSPDLVGTTVTLTEVGAQPVGATYQWQTDNGNGGPSSTFANAPSANAVTYTLPALGPGTYQYDVIVGAAGLYSTSSVASVTMYYQTITTNATMTALGLLTTPYTPGADDIYNTNEPAAGNKPGGLNPDGQLNFYMDNVVPPGEQFTTGANAQGYSLNSVNVFLSGDYGNLPVGGQLYYLRLYSVNTAQTNATLIATFTNNCNIPTAAGIDWIQVNAFASPITLAPNKTYAYTFGRDQAGAGWDGEGNISGGTTYYRNPGATALTDGACVMIAPAGGAMQISTNAVATFDIGLSLIAAPTLSIAKGPGAGQVTITYTGVLQSATNVKGTWSAVGGASSPWTVTASGTVFYRASSM
jgi:hypothetical protein